MRDELITCLNFSAPSHIPAESGAILLAASDQQTQSFIDCRVQGRYDLRRSVEDVMNASSHDEIEWASCLTNHDAVCFALSRIMATDIGRSLALDIRFEGWSFDILDEHEQSEISVHQRIIRIALPCSSLKLLSKFTEYKAQFIVTLFESLRRAWHINSGVPSSNLWAMEDYILWQRCVQADLDVMNIVLAYQDRNASSGELWKFILTSSLSSLAVQYASLLEYHDADPFMSDQDEAENCDDHKDILADIYSAWFQQSNIVHDCDAASLNSLDYSLSNPSSEYSVGQNRVMHEDLLLLSQYPEGGASYLEWLAFDLVHDDAFRALNNPLLKAHFEHIQADIELHKLESSNVIIFRDPMLQKIFQTGFSVDILG
jgi:hypothetical protein